MQADSLPAEPQGKPRSCGNSLFNFLMLDFSEMAALFYFQQSVRIPVSLHPVDTCYCYTPPPGRLVLSALLLISTQIQEPERHKLISAVPLSCLRLHCSIQDFLISREFPFSQAAHVAILFPLFRCMPIHEMSMNNTLISQSTLNKPLHDFVSLIPPSPLESG